MVKLVGPLLSASAKGMVGAMLFNRSGRSTVGGMSPGRSWPLTEKTARERARFQRVVRAWSALSASDRESWTINAPGDTVGFHLFVGCQLRLLSTENEIVNFLIPASDRAPYPKFKDLYGFCYREYDVANTGWSYELGEAFQVRVFVATSTLNRSVINERKHVFMGYTASWTGGFDFPLNPAIPAYFAILDYIDPATGLIGDKINLGRLPDYVEGMGVMACPPSMTIAISRLQKEKLGKTSTS